MDNFRKFAAFIREKKLGEYVAAYLDTIYQFNVPIMRFFTHLDKEQMLAIVRESSERFLIGLENDTVFENVKTSLDNWRNDKIPGISKNEIFLADIVLVYSAQKKSLYLFLSEFTDNVSTATEIVLSAEKFYSKTQELATEVLLEIQKEEERKKHELEVKYTVLFDNSSDLVYMADPEGKILHTNKAWNNVMGFAPQELANSNIYDFVSAEEKESFIISRKQLLSAQGEKALNICTTFINKGSEKVYLEGFLGARDDDDGVHYTLGILRNITERVLYEEALREVNKKFSNLIENAPDGILVHDSRGNILLTNPKCLLMFGRERDESLANRPVTELLPEAGTLFKEADGFLGKAFELKGQKKSGEIFPVSIIVSESEQDGAPVFIAFVRDISEEKRKMEELEKRRLLLEKYNRELEQYTRLSSHDLKEPVRKILFQSDLLLTRYGETLTDNVLQGVTKIHGSATRMNNLIEGILAVSAISEKEEHFKLVSLNEVIENVLAELEATIAEKNAVVNKDDLPVVEANPVQMIQLFENIIHNALKYSKPDVSPVISIYHKNEKPETASIYIEDNGIGFKNYYAEKVFDMFERLDNQQIEGTGIGLALCRKITEIHKGKITAKSNPGEGAVFEITLPKKQIVGSDKILNK